LIDSGATENFIDKAMWKGLEIGRIRLKESLTVHNVDGMENQQGKIEYYCWFKVNQQGKEVKMRFYLTDLRKDCFILGYPFLFVFNPNIDWRRGELKGGVIRLETAGFRQAQRRVDLCLAKMGHYIQTLKEGEEIWLRKMTTAQQWAHEA
jgi:hypothetical protein